MSRWLRGLEDRLTLASLVHGTDEAGAGGTVRLRASLGGGGRQDDAHLILAGLITQNGVDLLLHDVFQTPLRLVKQALGDSFVCCGGFPIRQEGGNLSDLAPLHLRQDAPQREDST